eukprot:5206227-Lingulodinium_polyedra.AAC.1
MTPQWFWSHASALDPRLREHPIRAQGDYQSRAWPLLFHGDGASFTSDNQSLITLSWSFLGSTE